MNTSFDKNIRIVQSKSYRVPIISTYFAFVKRFGIIDIFAFAPNFLYKNE